MSRTRIVIRLFLASPSDVTEERTIVEKVISEINSGIAAKLGILIELVRWEDVVPGMGRPQQVILDQVDIEDTDIFVGILWNRFGTPTGKAVSGTEEEFNVAYQAWERVGRPRIMFYFCQRPANLRTIDEINQKSAVIGFRDKLHSLGVVREFQLPEEFEALLRRDTTNHLFDARRIREGHPARVRPGDLNRGVAVTSKTDRKAVPKGMVLIPAGKFLAGRAPSNDSIDHDFYLDIVPVTNRDFIKFLRETGYMLSKGDLAIATTVDQLRLHAQSKPEHPVTLVSWFDAVAYAAWAGKRLPTSKEWEKAARGTDGRIYPWGNAFQVSRCNSSESGIGGTTPVDKYETGRSPYGCYDMAGNVFEWVDDWAERPRFSSAPNSEKINRGASYNRPAGDLVTYYIESDPPASIMSDVGFRCAADVE